MPRPYSFSGRLHQRALLPLAAPTPRRLPERGRRAAPRVRHAAPGQQLVDGQNLHTRILLVWEMLRRVDAGGQRFLPHRLGGLLAG